MKKTIFGRMTFNAWKKDRFGTIVFTAFVAISITLFSLTLLLFANLSGAINHLMKIAKTPDFLQMHAGPVEEAKLSEFASSTSGISQWQVCRFLNIENGMITLGEESLKDSTQDNGLCLQGEGFDYLLDLDNQLPEVRSGEVYVPVCYQRKYQVKIGDNMQIGDKSLIIAGFIRDSQMNSMMASSKRFLISKEDYNTFFELGSEEYLIEYLLEDRASISEFQTHYDEFDMPKNGPTITKPLVKMINVLSDGIMILIILLISFLVLTISMVCIRFILLTRVEQEKREIGILKALGISKKEIQKIFTLRYLILSLFGGIIGLGVSFLIFKPLGDQMQQLYGGANNQIIPILLSLVGMFVFVAIIMLFVYRLLRRINRVTALEALAGYEDKKAKKKRNGNRNRQYCIVIVVALGVFLMYIPANLYSTMSSPRFVTYMGIGDAQIRMDIRQTEEMEEKVNKMMLRLKEDAKVVQYALYQTRSITAISKNDMNENILVEQGNHCMFPVTYNLGEAPVKDGEIAISNLLAEELQVTKGDEIKLIIDGTTQRFLVTGIYSDITNGGKTAKISQRIESTDNIMWCIFYASLAKDVKVSTWLESYKTDGVKAVDIATYVDGTFGQTLSQIHKVSYVAKLVSAFIMILVIALFLRLFIQKNRTQISIQKAIGFKSESIQKTYITSGITYGVIGLLSGILLGELLGARLCGKILESFGAAGFRFVLNLPEILLVIPVVAIVAIVVAIYLGTKEVHHIRAIECCTGRE